MRRCVNSLVEKMLQSSGLPCPTHTSPVRSASSSTHCIEPLELRPPPTSLALPRPAAAAALEPASRSLFLKYENKYCAHTILCILYKSRQLYYVLRLTYLLTSLLLLCHSPLIHVCLRLLLLLLLLCVCCSQLNIGHKLLVFIQLYSVLPPPSSSCCTWYPVSTFFSPDLFTRCSLMVLCYCVQSTAVLVWQHQSDKRTTNPEFFSYQVNFWSKEKINLLNNLWLIRVYWITLPFSKWYVHCIVIFTLFS